MRAMTHYRDRHTNRQTDRQAKEQTGKQAPKVFIYSSLLIMVPAWRSVFKNDCIVDVQGLRGDIKRQAVPLKELKPFLGPVKSPFISTRPAFYFIVFIFWAILSGITMRWFELNAHLIDFLHGCIFQLHPFQNKLILRQRSTTRS